MTVSTLNLRWVKSSTTLALCKLRCCINLITLCKVTYIATLRHLCGLAISADGSLRATGLPYSLMPAAMLIWIQSFCTELLTSQNPRINQFVVWILMINGVSWCKYATCLSFFV